ncbi:hypothetical protein F2P81_007452 [Scophthalmus maximus]|uniref:Uncharacterized protein n=1 Tax=Scophthalmus maximus TaxID=52904 RepID=A0A6A4SZS2_SCOMX|nr:hypothetical protein F2P81_007452 [Scophthalmus maximus]
MAERLGDIEKNMTGKEKWDIGVKDTLIQLQSKVSPAEDNGLGRALTTQQHKDLWHPRKRRGLLNATVCGKYDYGGTGGQKPFSGAPPCSSVVRFLQFNIKEKILHAAWKKPIFIQEKRVFFDHDYTEIVQQTPIKKVLKEKRIRFQTPLTKMRKHFHSGTVTYSNAEEAAEYLKRRGFKVGLLPLRRSKDITVETVNKLLP